MSKLFSILVIVVALAGCKSPTSPANTPPANTPQRITGTVKDSATKTPIVGAYVLYGVDSGAIAQTVTDNSGAFHFDSVMPGTYLILADHNNYHASPRVDTVRVVSGSDANVALLLAPDPPRTSVHFHVVSAITHLGLAAEFITTNFDGSQAYFWASSNGDADFAGPAGEHIFSITFAGYFPISDTVSLIYGKEIYDTVFLTHHVDTLLAEYKFNGSSIDSSGNGHDGTLHGGTFVYDRFGNANSALQLNGTTDYISVPSAADLNFGQAKSFTLSFWSKGYAQNPNTSGRYIIHKSDNSLGVLTGYSITDSLNDLYMRVGTTAASYRIAEGDGENNQWHFFVFSVDASGTYVFYIDDYDADHDGGSTITRALRADMSNSAPLLIGGDGTAAHAFKGILDDIRIYQGALTGDEVDKLYHENGW